MISYPSKREHGQTIELIQRAESREEAADQVSIGSSIFSRRRLPRMDFSEGIPDEHRTLVVVPTFLESPESAARLVEQLEIRCLANRLPNLLFALLTDFPDAAEEHLAGDQRLADAALAGLASKVNGCIAGWLTSPSPSASRRGSARRSDPPTGRQWRAFPSISSKSGGVHVLSGPCPIYEHHDALQSTEWIILQHTAHDPGVRLQSVSAPRV
jgi:hypothetical protein